MSTDTLTRFLPEKIERPSSTADRPWNRVPLGVGFDGEVSWDMRKHPGLLVQGTHAFSGVPTVFRTALAHFADHSDEVRVFRLGANSRLAPDVARSGVVLHDSSQRPQQELEVLEFISNEIDERSKALADNGVDDFTSLPQKPYALIVTLEDLRTTLHDINAFDEDYYLSIEMSIRHLIAKIAQDRGKTGVFLLVGAVTSDAEELLDDEVRVALNAEYDLSDWGNTEKRVTGRGTFHAGDEAGTVVQGYFTSRYGVRGWVGPQWVSVKH